MEDKIQNSILKSDLSPEEYTSLISHFTSRCLNDGIVQELDADMARKILSNPDENRETLEKLAMYYYISNGDVFQLFDLTRILPTLKYNIKTLKRDKNSDKNIFLCKKNIKNINHTELTRDMISQLIVSGTLIGIWMGDKNNIYPMVFDDLEYFFPAYRKNGKWVVWCDLAYFDTLSEVDRENQLNNLSPYITKYEYEEYKKDPTQCQYVELPMERSICLRTHTIKRNQRFGVPWISQGIYDVIHKKKLRDLEKSVANKIINAIAVMTIGNEQNPNLELNPNLKKKVYGSAKEALETNVTKNSITMIGIPEFAKIEFPNLKSDALDPEKIKSVNEDITSTFGYSRVLTNGTGGNFASAKLNLDIIFRRISEILESIENEVYNKLFNIILPKNVSDNYYFEYDKAIPLTNKEKADIYFKLHSLGYSLKPLVEIVGDDYEELIESTLYEIETLKLRERVLPPQSSYTLGSDGSNKSGADSIDDNNLESGSTITSKENDGNSMPSPQD